MIPGLTARLLLDEDVDPAVAEALRQGGYDALHVVEAARQGLSDDAQLAFAAAEGLVLLTHNRNDFLELAAIWWDQGRHHAGIIHAQHAPVGKLLRLLVTLLDRMTAEEFRNVVLPLEAYRQQRSKDDLQ